MDREQIINISYNWKHYKKNKTHCSFSVTYILLNWYATYKQTSFDFTFAFIFKPWSTLRELWHNSNPDVNFN